MILKQMRRIRRCGSQYEYTNVIILYIISECSKINLGKLHFVCLIYYFPNVMYHSYSAIKRLKKNSENNLNLFSDNVLRVISV